MAPVHQKTGGTDASSHGAPVNYPEPCAMTQHQDLICELDEASAAMAGFGRYPVSELLHRSARALEAARREPLTGWQPIDTAPKDGTDVLVLFECAGQAIAHIAWYRSREEWEICGQYSGGWGSLAEWEGWWSYTRNSVSQEKLEGLEAPTHWMPLPAPPAGITAASEGKSK